MAAPSRPDVTSAANASLVGQVADEFLQRIEAGEQPSVEEYAQRHPEAATELRQVLAALVLLDRSSASSLPGALATPPLVDGVLGDYRLGREIGRGGMGVVYEAQQISLKRRVALKVLPLAGLLDDQLLKRFHNEALAAASLAHPHIVSIYNVGCERGIHYYAMQFVDGLSLDKVIAGLQQTRGAAPHPQPLSPEYRGEGSQSNPSPSPRYSGERAGVRGEAVTNADTSPIALLSTAHSGNKSNYFRRVAELGAQAAEALQYAHDVGIIHRDVKPANLLLDKQGKVWIADFGLARIEGAGDLTHTGDLIGTCRYMSPEQARGERASVDHRTDIYSLGVTLYELLALRPALSGKSHEEVLRQLSQDRPTALRKLESSLPRDLETIVFKAIAHDPVDRYRSAGELAQDLRSFLQQLPIRARPYTLLQRTRSWVRRHPGTMLTAVLSLTFVAAAMSVAAFLAMSADQRTRNALEEAGKNLKAANDNKQEMLSALYVADIPSAQKAFRSGDLVAARTHLERHIPANEHDLDRRGFEWHYLWRLCNRPPRVIQAHDFPISGIAIAPSGRWLASGDDHGWVKLWTIPELEPARDLVTHLGDLRSLYFLDNDELLTLGSEGTILRWNPETREGLGVFASQPSKIVAAALSTDKSRLATTGEDMRVRVWSINTGELQLTSEPFSARLESIAFDLNADRLFVGDINGSVHAMDIPQGKLQTSIFCDSKIQSMFLSSTPPMLVICCGNTSLLYRLPSLSYDGYATAANSGDALTGQRLLATGGNDRYVRLWEIGGNPTHLELRRTLPRLPELVRRVQFSPDSRWLAAGCFDGRLMLTDQFLEGEQLRNLNKPMAERPNSALLSRSGKLFVTTSSKGVVQIWESATGDELATCTVANPGTGFWSALSPDKTQLALGSHQGGVEFWNIANQRKPRLVSQPEELKGWRLLEAWSNNGRWVAVALPSKLALWDVRGQTLVKTWSLEHPAAAAFTSDDLYLMAATDQGEVIAYDLSSGESVSRTNARGEGAYCLAVSTNSRFVVRGGEQGMDVFAFPSLARITSIGATAYGVGKIRFSPDGRTMACAAEGDVQLWNVATWRELCRLNLLGHNPEEIRFTPDGRKLIVAGYPGQVTTFSLDE